MCGTACARVRASLPALSLRCVSLGPSTPTLKVVAKWKSLAQRGKEVRDPWDEFRMEEECREEKAVRHLYNPRKKSWRVDEVTVKMQDKVRTQVLCKYRVWGVAGGLPENTASHVLPHTHQSVLNSA